MGKFEEIQEKLKKEKELSSIPQEDKKPLYDISLNQTTDQQPPIVQVKSNSPEEFKVAPENDIAGFRGAVTRGVTVPASQALAGAILGSPLGPPGMLAGAAAAPIVFGLGDLAIEGINAYFGKDFQTSRGAITHLLDSLGTPKPDTAAERITESVTEGLLSGGGSAYGFKQAGKIAKAGTRLQKVSEFMGQKPLEQLAMSGLASGASFGVQEAGGGPVTSAIAGLGAAAAIPLTRGGYRAIFPTQEMKELRALEKLRGVYQTVLPEEAQRQQATQQIRQAAKEADKDVSLMAGEVTRNEGLLALQREMERSSQAVAERRAANIAGVSKKLEKGLEDVGASPEEASKFFESEYNSLKKQHELSLQDLESTGLAAESQLESAKDVLYQVEKDLESKKITSKQAYEKAKQVLGEAVNIEKLRQSGDVRANTNRAAATVMTSQRKSFSDYATLLYNKIQGVDPFKPETAVNTIENLVPSGAVSKLERVSGKTQEN